MVNVLTDRQLMSLKRMLTEINSIYDKAVFEIISKSVCSYRINTKTLEIETIYPKEAQKALKFIESERLKDIKRVASSFGISMEELNINEEQICC